MVIQKKRGEKARTVPKHIRFPGDVGEWLGQYAKEHGFSSDAELVRQIVHKFKQQAEQAR